MNNTYFKLPLIIIALIIGVAIFKDFNFSTMTFKKPWLDIVYIIAFILTLIFIFKNKSK